MPSYARSRDVVVAAPPELCFDVLTDHARMPEWQRSVKRAAVLSGSPAEGEAVVEYELDVRLRSVVYRLRELYERPHRVGSEYAGGDMRDMGGEWTFAPERAGATLVTFSMHIDPGFAVPRLVAKMLEKQVMGRAVDDLRVRAEALAGA